jgi:hypothetical protein
MLFFNKKLLCVLGLLSLANVSQATPVVLTGDHFSVTYDDALVGLYRDGALSGSQDTVYFQPTQFAAVSGGSPTTTPAALQLRFSIDPGYAFTGLTVTSRGDYFGVGSGTVDAAASVGAVNPDTLASTLLNLALGAPLTQAAISAPWEASGNLSALGLGTPQTLDVTLDTTLFANAAVGSIAFIQNTYAGFRVGTQVVPEPAGWSLLLGGLMAATFIRGKRRRRG